MFKLKKYVHKKAYTFREKFLHAQFIAFTGKLDPGLFSAAYAGIYNI